VLKRLFWLAAAVAGIFAVLAALSYQGDVPVEALLSKYARPPSRFIQIDGMSVHYRDTGKGPVILLLHGNTASLHTWDAWADTLDDDYRVIRLDLPGFGLTGPQPDGKYEIGYIVDFMQRFLSALNVDKASIAGSSHGGFVGWSFAVAHPEMVHKLCLIASGGYPLTYKYWVFGVRDWTIFKLMYPVFTPRWAANFAVRGVYGDPTKVTQELTDRYYDLHLRTGNRQAGIKMMPIYNVKDPEPIRQIKAPTQIMWGDKDVVIGVEHAERFAHDIEGSKLIIYKGVGHMPMEEIPAESVADFKHFLADTP